MSCSAAKSLTFSVTNIRSSRAAAGDLPVRAGIHSEITDMHRVVTAFDEPRVDTWREHLVIGLAHRAGVTTTVGDALARLDEAYVPLEIIGSDEADAMTTRLSVALLALGLDLDHEPGKSAAPDRDPEADVREIQRLREGLRAQFRKDLAVVLPSKPGGRRRLGWRGPKVLTANGNLAEREYAVESRWHSPAVDRTRPSAQVTLAVVGGPGQIFVTARVGVAASRPASGYLHPDQRSLARLLSPCLRRSTGEGPALFPPQGALVMHPSTDTSSLVGEQHRRDLYLCITRSVMAERSRRPRQAAAGTRPDLVLVDPDRMYHGD